MNQHQSAIRKGSPVGTAAYPCGGGAVDYAAWREHLFAELVRSGTMSRPLYLFVDRDDLAVVSGLSPSDAVEEFLRCVREGGSAHAAVQT